MYLVDLHGVRVDEKLQRVLWILLEQRIIRQNSAAVACTAVRIPAVNPSNGNLLMMRSVKFTGNHKILN